MGTARSLSRRLARGHLAKTDRGLPIDLAPTGPIPIDRVPIGPGPTARNPMGARRGRRLTAPSPIGPARTDRGHQADRRGHARIGLPAAARFRIEDRALRGATTARAGREDRRAVTGRPVRRWKTRSAIGPSVSVGRIGRIGAPIGGPTRAGLVVPQLVAGVASSRPNGDHSVFVIGQ